jgi:hypothetical protein
MLLAEIQSPGNSTTTNTDILKNVVVSRTEIKRPVVEVELKGSTTIVKSMTFITLNS